jgi:hypothetical protein
MLNVHTCTTSSVDMIIVIVHSSYGKFVQVSCNVISGTRVSIPVGIHTIGSCIIGVFILPK